MSDTMYKQNIYLVKNKPYSFVCYANSDEDARRVCPVNAPDEYTIDVINGTFKYVREYHDSPKQHLYHNKPVRLWSNFNTVDVQLLGFRYIEHEFDGVLILCHNLPDQTNSVLK
jgi:hypothetical protein